MKAGEAEREFLAAEAQALADRIPGEEGRPYRDIAAAALAGEVPEQLGERIGQLLALSLESGRARSVHGPAGVRALTAVWKETPQAREVARELEDLGRALTALRGLPLEAVRLSATGPGAYAVSIAAGGHEVRLSVDRTGVRLRSLNVGGGGVGE